MGGKDGGTRSGVKGVKREHETLWAGEWEGKGKGARLLLWAAGVKLSHQ